MPDTSDPCLLDDPDDSGHDGRCDHDDRCPGFDDRLETDGDDVPDGCDLPSCGNGVTEAGEACDGRPLCTADCKQTDEGRCIDADSTWVTEACMQCRCRLCTQEMLDCFANPDPSFAEDCRQLLICGDMNHCYDNACYCGTSSNCGVSANGPCKTEITAAADVQNETPYQCYQNTSCSVYQSLVVGNCIHTNCHPECAP